MSGGNYSSDDCQNFSEPDCLLQPLCAKRLGPGQEIYRFKPIRLPLPIISVDDIEPRAPLNSPTQIAKVRRLNCSEQHATDISMYMRSEERRVGKECRSRWS